MELIASISVGDMAQARRLEVQLKRWKHPAKVKAYMVDQPLG